MQLSTPSLEDIASEKERENWIGRSNKEDLNIRRAIGWRKKTLEALYGDDLIPIADRCVDALECVRKSLEFDPDDMLSLRYEVTLLLNLKRDDEAKTVIKNITNRFPNEQWLWVMWVGILCNQQKFDEITILIDQARKDSGSMSIWWLLKGRVASYRNDFKGAKAAFERVLEDDSYNTQARVDKEEVEKALQAQQKTIEKKEQELYGNEQETMSERKGSAVLEPVRHPGDIIRKELLETTGLEAKEIATQINVNPGSLYNVIGENRVKRRPLTLELAAKLAPVFEAHRDKVPKVYTAKELFNLQVDYDLQEMGIEPRSDQNSSYNL